MNTADINEFTKDTEAAIERARAARGTGQFTRFHAGSYFYVDNKDTVWHIFYRSDRKEWVVCDYIKDDNVDARDTLSIIRRGFKYADGKVSEKTSPQTQADLLGQMKNGGLEVDFNDTETRTRANELVEAGLADYIFVTCSKILYTAKEQPAAKNAYPSFPSYQCGDRVIWEGNLMKVVSTHGDYYNLAYLNPRRVGEPNEEMVGVSVLEYADSEETRNHWTYAISGW